MPQPQVNRIRLTAALSLALACAPASNKGQGTESASVTRTDTAVAGSRAPTDSNITRADLARIQGSATAPVWVIEVSDFQCPYCKQWHDQTYPALLDQYIKTGKVRMAYVNYPLSIHRHAMPAAEAAMCAGVQNKFWPMHDTLFSSQSRWETLPNAMPTFDSLAAHLGVAMPAWRDCVARHLTRPLIEADYARSQSAGVRSTPTFFIGDEKVEGYAPYAGFRPAIEAQLAKKSTSR